MDDTRSLIDRTIADLEIVFDAVERYRNAAEQWITLREVENVADAAQEARIHQLIEEFADFEARADSLEPITDVVFLLDAEEVRDAYTAFLKVFADVPGRDGTKRELQSWFEVLEDAYAVLIRALEEARGAEQVPGTTH